MGSHRTAVGVGGWVLGLALASASWCLAVEADGGGGGGGGGGAKGRLLLGFRETQGNASFQCSPSGPCLPCQYSEKNDEKYRCSETGYRVPLKCVEIQDGVNDEINKIHRRLSSLQEHSKAVQKNLLTAITNYKWRKLLDDSFTSEGGKRGYITYRSCVPVDDEEKLSVLGFEVIMVGLLLISGPVVYLRQKRTIIMPGAGAMRIPTNSPRF
ncbi:uncharacterized protein LOC103718998 [Phoenix dactylifera]|uniref:Uncharacterized protein LOC103718998 n=1 Tax=Phoenix dactylifera TaxID=42345 RepID=A0A8B9AYR1_PHODC|nr:uncharacterized protein LOC103718998 [Phoenix dactylifera]